MSYPYFDWLRFLLASVVALQHDGTIAWAFSATLAVQVFFALSGWLIGGILLRSEPHDLPHFFFNRAARIWIPYGVALAVLYGLSFIHEPISLRRLELLFYDVTFTRYWFGSLPTFHEAAPYLPLGSGGHLWSISVEEQFYLFAPILLVLLKKWGRSPIMWGAIAILLSLISSGFASVSMGVCAACTQQRAKDWHLQPLSIVILASIAIASFPIIYNLEMRAFALVPLFSICVVLLIAHPGRRNELGLFVGGISYPLYLNQWIGRFGANSIVKRLDSLLPYQDLIAYNLTFAVAVALYMLVDMQVKRMRDRYYSPRIARAVTISAYSIFAIGMTFGIIRWGLFPA